MFTVRANVPSLEAEEMATREKRQSMLTLAHATEFSELACFICNIMVVLRCSPGWMSPVPKDYVKFLGGDSRNRTGKWVEAFH